MSIDLALLDPVQHVLELFLVRLSSKRAENSWRRSSIVVNGVAALRRLFRGIDWVLLSVNLVLRDEILESFAARLLSELW